MNMVNRIFYFLIILSLGSCSVNKDLMFKTPKGYVYDEIPSQEQEEYRISADDRLSFRLFTNNGHVLIDFSSGEDNAGANSRLGAANLLTYLVERNGEVEFPTLGRVNLLNKTLLEAEVILEELYAKYYKGPFVMLNVMNRRVIVSTGDGGTAKVLNLSNNNITVIEALSLAGGIADRGNSSQIKVIRTVTNGKTEVYKIDLSTIEGLNDGNMIVQADDIIYVEPTPQIASEVLRDVAPVISLVSSAIFIISVINSN